MGACLYCGGDTWFYALTAVSLASCCSGTLWDIPAFSLVFCDASL